MARTPGTPPTPEPPPMETPGMAETPGTSGTAETPGTSGMAETPPAPGTAGTARRERRSPTVVLLDAMMRLAIAAQSGPQPKLRPAGRTRRGSVGWLAAGIVLAVAGTAIVVAVLIRGPGDLASLPPRAPDRARVAEPAPSVAPPESAAVAPTSPAAATGASSAAASASAAGVPSPDLPSLPPSGRAPSSRPAPVAAPLAAAFRTSTGGTGLLGYEAEIAITNPGAVVRDGWDLTVTLPRPTLQIARVSGATARQDGSTWTFEPGDATRAVPAGGSVVITFQVRGATLLDAAPQECRIDGAPCAGTEESPPS